MKEKRRIASLLVALVAVVALSAAFWRPLAAQSQDLITRIRNIEVAIWGAGNIGGGPLNPTLGLGVTGKPLYCTIPIGSVAYGSLGTSAVTLNATSYSTVAGITVDRNVTVTGIKVLAGGTAGTSDHWEAAIYPGLGGNIIAATASTATTATGDVFKTLSFTTPVSLIGPGKYGLGFQSDGTTEYTRTIAASTYPDVFTLKPASTTYGTWPSIAFPASFVADVGVIACLVVSN